MKKYVLLMAVITLLLSSCGRPDANGEDDVITIRLAHLVSEVHSSHIAAEKFAEQLETESDGRLNVELYPNGSLFPSDREAVESVQLGNVEMTIPALATVSSFNKKFRLFDLPYLFEDYEHVYNTLDGEIGQSLLDDLEKNNLKGLVYGENGFRHIINDRQPIEKPSDLEGLKLRTLESPVQTAVFNAFGANASPFAFGEMYTALQQGTYDAMEAPVTLVHLAKFNDVQQYLSMTSHIYMPTVLLMNNEFFEGLPADLQDIVLEASKDFRDNQRQLAREQDEKWLVELKKSGMEINELSPEQLDAFRKASLPVYDKYKDQIGEGTIREILKSNDKWDPPFE